MTRVTWQKNQNYGYYWAHGEERRLNPVYSCWSTGRPQVPVISVCHGVLSPPGLSFLFFFIYFFFYSKVCSSTAGSSPPPESSNFLCPLLSLPIPLPVAPQGLLTLSKNFKRDDFLVELFLQPVTLQSRFFTPRQPLQPKPWGSICFSVYPFSCHQCLT